MTLVRHSYPRELIKELKAEGFEVVEIHNGIYHIKGRVSVDVQLVVTSRLPDGEYEGLKLLSKGATKENVIGYVEKAIQSRDTNIKENAGTVIEICLSVNKKLKEVKTMHEIIREMFKKDFYDERQEGIHEANERMAIDMLKDREPLAEDVIRGLAASLGVSVM